MSDAPKGISSAELVGSGAMGGSHSVGHAAGIGGGHQGLGSAIGQEGGGVDTILSSSKIGNLGEGASIDHLTKLIGGEGALEANPFDQAFSGNQSPFGVSHEGFNMKLSGDVSLDKIAPKEQLSAGPGIPGVGSFGQGQSH